jgi:hypothetical protein
MRPTVFSFVSTVAGVALVAYAAFAIFPPAAYVVGGVYLILVGQADLRNQRAAK